MAYFTRLFTVIASIFFITCSAVAPEAVYDGGFGKGNNDTIKLVIGNGGAGQSGLIEGVCDD